MGEDDNGGHSNSGGPHSKQLRRLSDVLLTTRGSGGQIQVDDENIASQNWSFSNATLDINSNTLDRNFSFLVGWVVVTIFPTF